MQSVENLPWSYEKIMEKACIIENSLNRWNVQIHMAWKTWKISCFREVELKSAVIFFKYILLNKTSIPGTSSKLLNMFKMTWLMIKRMLFSRCFLFHFCVSRMWKLQCDIWYNNKYLNQRLIFFLRPCNIWNWMEIWKLVAVFRMWVNSRSYCLSTNNFSLNTAVMGPFPT